MASGRDFYDYGRVREVDVAIASRGKRSNLVSNRRETIAFSRMDDDDEALIVAEGQVDPTEFTVSSLNFS